MKNDWEKKATCSAYLSTMNNQALPWVRSIQRQRSNWSPTYILHLFHLEDTSLLFLFISESVKVRFLPRVDSFSFCPRTTCCLLFLNSAHAQDVFTLNAIWIDLNIVIQTIILITIVLGLFRQKKSYLLQHNSVLIFILRRSVRKSTIILGMKKLRSW
jgi:hypothetical protein